MKKRKTYEISVIDKTYSKTISDETKFYTSDTALELGFELKETEYDFESAEIVLLNIDDRSLTTRPVAKVNNDFVYEIDDDITTHYGEWRGQLMLVEKGEVHVSSPIKFRIENDLYSNKPLEITEVVSWVSLKKYANVLVDELKQAVDEAVAKVETMDETFKANELDRDNAEKERQSRFEVAESEREKGENIRVETFQTNETERQNQFTSAEQSRQTTFETNESGRNETFESNETTRQTQELEREKAEATRQQAESQRQSTFETNETERQNQFETAEQERQSAENIRVENENQRKLTSVEEFIKLQDAIGGRNYFKSSDIERTNKTEFLNSSSWDMSPLIDTFGVDVYYTLSFDIKSEIGGNIQVYSSNGSNEEYKIGVKNINVNTEYQRFSYTFKPTSSSVTVSQSNLAFYGTYNSGRIPTVKNVKFEVGINATPYTKAPEDYTIVSKEYYYNHIKLMNEFKDNQFNELKKAVLALGGTI